MTEKAKRRSRVLEALEKQAEVDKARDAEEPDIGTDLLDELYKSYSQK